MDASVRTSLKNLQGLLDEGFVTQAEFNQRRKAIIDAATTVKPSLADSAASTSAGKPSVFSRLGDGDATGRTGGGSSSGDKWKHDGFAELYGGRKVVVQKPSAAAQIRKPLAGGISKAPKGGDLRARLTGGADLRAKLSGGAKGPKAAKKLPAKCPW